MIVYCQACRNHGFLLLNREVLSLKYLDLPKAVKPLWRVPFSRDAMFIDRIEIFKEIDERAKTQPRIALTGIGGIG